MQNRFEVRIYANVTIYHDAGIKSKYKSVFLVLQFGPPRGGDSEADAAGR